ncbi:Ca2+ regulator and membrane fusion protein Fig1-domain-containing protein [Lipomyces tetrasporus]|uniref:Ca2+ regulator and membrane fusion protein Fig1-domain-containing protein n=1 Tax=Lipomyces tetrasporus TaxID=54092 RepID=A0AAD7VVC7_9ASCO|nr:Ca2+ regulator and membrane fusion protein Fig1-domain-containing protein [Lipomyces tetrasporus]KAJ8102834.1 Ca2+ regulator and membrane fusion protein Fig1-domain-containing protein [Lipomyces tetrasporus]
MTILKVEFLSLTFVRPRHVFLLLLIVSIILMSLLLAGCSSSFSVMPRIYLLNVGYNGGTVYQVTGDTVVNPDASVLLGDIVGQTQLEVRIGYFAVCLRSAPGAWLCSQNATSLAQNLYAYEDPINLLHVAQTFREKIVFPYLLIIAAALSFIGFVLILPYPPLLKTVCVGICFLSAILVLISVLWQHTASVAAATVATNLANGTVFTGVGITAMILGWFSFGLLTLTVIGVYFFVAINALHSG